MSDVKKEIKKTKEFNKFLIKNKLASPPSHRWRHDLRFNFNPPHLTDCKRIETDNFNITDPKTYYNLKQSIFEKNMLTHFLFLFLLFNF